MFGESPSQKVLSGLSCAVLILMFVLMALFAFGVFSNERYEYKIPKSELGVKFGCYIEPSLKDYVIPAAILSLELAKKERAVPYSF